MPWSSRLFYRQLQGRTAFNHNFGGSDIDKQSAILITAAPCTFTTPFFSQDVRLNVHGPDIRVTNVVPHGDEGGGPGVEFVLTVDALTDVAVTITVLDKWDLTSGWTIAN